MLYFCENIIKERRYQDMKKISILLASLVMMFCLGITVYGDEYDRNQNVRWLSVDGIDLNDVTETKTVPGVNYNAITNTLTLYNCNIQTNQSEFIDYYGDIPLNIEIKGTNTITGYEENNIYRVDFISCESDGDGTDSSVNVYGGGKLNLNKIRTTAENHILVESRNCTTLIKDVTINVVGGGFYSHRGNLNIENATVKIDNTDGKGFCGIDIGSNLDEIGGSVKISNSTVEVKTAPYDAATYYDVLECRFLNVNGLNIYAGGNSARWSANEKTLLGYEYSKDSSTPSYPTKKTEDYIGYVLITPEKKNLPDISTAKNNNTTKDAHTSTYTKGQKTATYFASGYTGDSVCSVCGMVISRGTTIAKMKLGTPTVKAGKKRITVKYKAVSGATGFQIRYKKAKGKWVTKKYKGNKSCSKVFKKLKKGKKYSVQIRAVKGSAYSDWSKTKTVKVK